MKALNRQWELKLERARYEALRAQRQYDAVDPDNRLVARTLEQQWEQALRAVEQLEREYATWKLENQSEITPQNRQEILAIGEDLPKVWNAQTTTNTDRKYLLRLIVKQVIVDQKREQGKVWFQINWQTGACTQHIFTRTCISYREHGEAARIEQRVRELHANGVNDRLIAETLNAEGLRTTYGQPFKYQNVCDLRSTWGIQSAKEEGLEPDRPRPAHLRRRGPLRRHQQQAGRRLLPRLAQRRRRHGRDGRGDVARLPRHPDQLRPVPRPPQRRLEARAVCHEAS